MAGSGTAHLRTDVEPLLRVEKMVVEFPVGRTGLKVHAVSDVSIDVPGRGAQTVPANDIREIEWEGEPALIKRARSEENGRLRSTRRPTAAPHRFHPGTSCRNALVLASPTTAQTHSTGRIGT